MTSHSRLRADQIAAIYAAISDPATMLLRMSQIVREALDVDSAGLWLIDDGIITDLALTEDISASIPDYLAYFQTLDPWGGATPKALNTVFAGTDAISKEALLKTEFYNDFARHYGMVNPMGLTVAVQPGSLATIATNRTEGRSLLQPLDKPVIAELGLHIGSALRLHRHFAVTASATDARFAALDPLAFGAVVCSADSSILYVNATAHGLVERHGALVLGNRSDGLGAATPPSDASLKALIAGAAAGRPGALRLPGRDGIGIAIFATPLVSDGLLPHLQRKALICFNRTDANPAANPNVLMELFGLSAAQSMLCVQLSAGKTFEEAALERGIAVSTARTHFEKILIKTNTRNLRDLLRMLASLPQVTLFTHLLFAALAPVMDWVLDVGPDDLLQIAGVI